MPTDAVIPDFTRRLDDPDGPASVMARAVPFVKEMIRYAVSMDDVDAVVALRTAGEDLVAAVKERDLSRELHLVAMEIVRRAERGLAQVIRHGQLQSTFMTPGFHRQPNRRSPKELMPSGRTTMECYGLADGVSDAEFEEALASARKEGNFASLSRSNVLRHLRGDFPVVAPLPEQETTAIVSAAAQRRALVAADQTLAGIAQALRDITRLHPDITQDEIQAWVRGLSSSRTTITTLINMMRRSLDGTTPSDADAGQRTHH